MCDTLPTGWMDEWFGAELKIRGVELLLRQDKVGIDGLECSASGPVCPIGTPLSLLNGKEHIYKAR